MLVLCPMRMERAAVGAAIVRAGLRDVRVVQTGVGKAAVLAALDRELPLGTPSTIRHVILAGLCGALRPVEEVPSIARVVDERGRSWTPANSGPDPAAVTIIGADSIISTPADKRALARSSGAAIVDMEAHAFAPACDSRNIPWSIVRGVSDTPDETLPHEVLSWITPKGNSRPLRAALAMFLRPHLIPHVFRFVRRSTRVMPRVGANVVRLARGGEMEAPAFGGRHRSTSADADPSLLSGAH